MEPRGLWDEPPPPEPPVDEVRGQPRRQVGPVVLTVGAVNRLVRDSLRRQPRLNPVWVEGEIGNAMDQLIMYCFHYDPSSRRY